MILCGPCAESWHAAGLGEPVTVLDEEGTRPPIKVWMNRPSRGN